MRLKNFCLAFILFLSINTLSFGQDVKISMDYGVGDFTFSSARENSYLRNIEDVKITNTIPGIKFRYGLNNLKASLRVGYMSQSMQWDSINVAPYSDLGVWSSLKMDFNRIQFFIGLGYEIKFNKFYLEPEGALMFSKTTKYEVEELINYTFTEFQPAEYSIDVDEYGGRISLELGYYISDKITIGVRPGYFYGELEQNIVRESGINLTGKTESYTNGFVIGIDIGWLLK